jgi:hypothetical protein
MTDRQFELQYEIVAYRVEGEPGWRMGEAFGGVDVTADLKSQGVAVAEVRTITAGIHYTDQERSGVAGLDFYTIHTPIDHGWPWDEVAKAWRAPEEPLLTLPGKPTVVEAIEVNFGEAHVGWQPVFLSAAKHSTRFHASDVYDPFPEIIQWLEIIARGECGRVVVNQEGSYQELLALPVTDRERVRIVVSVLPRSEDGFREIELDIDISRRRFVGAFYGALHAHAESEDYDPYQWTFRLLKDDLVRSGIAPSPEQLAGLDATSLRDVVDGFIVPEDFDTWDAVRRLTFVSELLDAPSSGCSATDLRKLRSTELEDFLASGR